MAAVLVLDEQLDYEAMAADLDKLRSLPHLNLRVLLGRCSLRYYTLLVPREQKLLSLCACTWRQF